jgi:hypothetical protein
MLGVAEMAKEFKTKILFRLYAALFLRIRFKQSAGKKNRLL